MADRIDRGLLNGQVTEAMSRYREAIDQGLLKIMAKMGISVISSYRGSLNFEAVGLSRAMCANISRVDQPYFGNWCVGHPKEIC